MAVTGPCEGALDDTLALFRRLLALGDHIVLRADGAGGPSVLLGAWLALLRAAGGYIGAGGGYIGELPKRATEEALKLLPLLLKRLRPYAPPGSDVTASGADVTADSGSPLWLVIESVRGVLGGALPISFHELEASQVMGIAESARCS